MRRKETGQNDLAWKPQLSPPPPVPPCASSREGVGLKGEAY